MTAAYAASNNIRVGELYRLTPSSELLTSTSETDKGRLCALRAPIRIIGVMECMLMKLL
jgi:hypothetical protein